jgi:hypothetical protein
MTFGPLEGVIVCLCRSLIGEILIVKAQGPLDLHLGHESHRLDNVPPSLWSCGNKLDEKNFFWRNERTPWRRKLAPLFSMFGLGGSKRYFLEYDVILGGLGFHDVGLFDDKLAHIDEGIPLHLNIWPLKDQHLPKEPQCLVHYAKTPLRGMTSSYRVLFYVTFEF